MATVTIGYRLTSVTSSFLTRMTQEDPMPNEDENAGVNGAVDALHRAAGCFHALLSVLQRPLATCVAKARVNGPQLTPEYESEYGQLSMMGLRKHLQFVLDHGATHFKAAEAWRSDVEVVLQVQLQAFHAACVEVESYETGIAAVLRLLVEFGADEDTQRQGLALKTAILDWNPADTFTSAREIPAHAATAGSVEEEHQMNAAETSGPERSATPLHDEESSTSSQVSADDSNLSAILEEALSQTAAEVDFASDEKHEEKHAPQSWIVKGDFAAAVARINEELETTTVKRSTQTKLLVMRARCQFELKQYLRVCADCQTALTIDKTLVEAYQWSILALIELNRLSEAHSMCSAGLKIDASDTKLKVLERKICRMSSAVSAAKASMSERSSDTASSGSGAEKISTQAPEPTGAGTLVETAIAHGHKLILVRDSAAAEASFTKALELLASSATTKRLSVFGHRARCRLSLKRYEAALLDAREALTINPKWLEGHRLACKAFMGLERLPEARAECEMVLQGAPKDVVFQRLKQVLEEKTARPAQPGVVSPPANQWQAQVKTLVQVGLSHVQKGKLKQAEKSFTEALAALVGLDNSSADATIVKARVKVLGHRARCRLELKSFQNAASDAQAGIALEPDWTDGYRLLCLAQMGASQWSDALVACQRVLKDAPKDTVFLKHLAVLKERCRAGSSSNAPSLLSQFEALARHAIDHLKMKEYEVAASHCTIVIQLMDKTPLSSQLTPSQKSRVLINRARCWVAMHKYQAALEDARLGLLHSPDWAEALRLECISLMGLDRWREALHPCEQVLKRVPTDTTFQAHKVSIAEKIQPLTPPAPMSSVPQTNTKAELAQLKSEGLKLFTAGDLLAAESAFSAAIARLGTGRSKKSASFFGDRARCRISMGKFHEALSDARESLVCNSSWTEGFRLQCHAFMRLEKWQDASQMCRRVLELAPQDAAFLTIKTQINDMIQSEDGITSKGKAIEVAEPTSPAVEEQPREEDAALKNPPGLKVDEPSPRIRELETFALNGSIVAQRFLLAQTGLRCARSLLKIEDIENIQAAYNECRMALGRWPQLEIPSDIIDDLRSVGPHDAIDWGGPMLFFHLQAASMTFDDYVAERDYWKQAVERFPFDYQLHTKLAFVLYAGGETNAALKHIEEALCLDVMLASGPPGFITPARCWYLRAMCSPVEAPALSWLTNVLFSEPKARTRGKDLLKYFQDNTVDDEWMPHACYTLGVLHLDKQEYVEATQFFFFAQEAEIRRRKLRLFPDIDESKFQDKAVLRAAFDGPNRKLSPREEYEAVNRRITCTWCGVAVTVNTLFEHKLEQCAQRPKLQIKIGQ